MTANEMNAVIDNLCNRFGTTVEHLIPEIINYLRVSDAMILIILTVCLIICLVALLLVYKDVKRRITEENKKSYDHYDLFDFDGHFGACVLLLCGIVGLLISGLIFVHSLILDYSVPYVRAIRYLFRFMK